MEDRRREGKISDLFFQTHADQDNKWPCPSFLFVSIDCRTRSSRIPVE
jgi:hypothetical protein